MKILLFTIFLTLAAVFPVLAFAHELDTVGTIGMTMHVDPNDAPLAQNLAVIVFLAKDAKTKFDFSACTCGVTISQNNKIISNHAIVAKDIVTPNEAHVSATFPKAGAYQITFSGKPKSGDMFEAFHFNYPVTASEATSTQTTIETSSTADKNKLLLMIGVGTLGGIGVLAGLFYGMYRLRTRQLR